LAAFDAPVMAVNCERRVPSTSAPQSLMLMNNDFIIKQAGYFAERLRAETPADYARDSAGPLAAQYPSRPASWQYGWGEFNPVSQRLEAFTPLPHFTGSAWQGGEALPDPALGWVILHAGGGHAGNDLQHAAVRRWTAPRAGVLSLSGSVSHPSENGDGVRARVISSRSGLAGEWTVKSSDAATAVAGLAVAAGDTLDFVVDCLGDVNSDSFGWTVELSLADEQGAVLGRWNSAADFHGPLGTPLAQQVAYAWQLAYQREISVEELEWALDFLNLQMAELQAESQADPEWAALTNLCQQLLSSNEFLYVD
jgi:hypothetical protein